jgi:hypothetical protein
VLQIASRLLFALALACACAFAAEGPAPPKQLRVLFIGNSLTSTGDIPARFAKLAGAMGRKATVEMVAFPDYGLDDHWRDGRALEAIKKGWDVVVLQDFSSTRPESRAQLAEYTRRFAKTIREVGAKPALYMVWPSTDKLREFSFVITAHRAAAESADAILLPVGEAWLRAMGTDKRLKLHSDTLNPNSLGQDLAVITIYLTLFPAGQYEFDEAFVARAAKALEIPADRRDMLFDAATRAIDEPLEVKSP